MRVDGGFLVLNFIKYRHKDHSSTERGKRWRERQRLKAAEEEAARAAADKEGVEGNQTGVANGESNKSNAPTPVANASRSRVQKSEDIETPKSEVPQPPAVSGSKSRAKKTPDERFTPFCDALEKYCCVLFAEICTFQLA